MSQPSGALLTVTVKDLRDPKPKMRAAKFEEATFDLPPEGAEMTISIQYSFF